MKVMHAREKMYNMQFAYEFGKDTVGVLTGMEEGVEAMVSIMNFGRKIFYQLQVNYSLAGEYITEVVPYLVFSREFLNQKDRIISLNSIVSRNISHARRLESRLDNPKMVALAYQEIPQLPPGMNIGGIIKHLDATIDERLDYRK